MGPDLIRASVCSGVPNYKIYIYIYIKPVVNEVAEEEIGVAEHRVHYHWFDQECREAAKERKQARLLTIQNSDNLEI